MKPLPGASNGEPRETLFGNLLFIGHGDLLGYARGCLRRRPGLESVLEADDLVQVASLTAWRRLDRFHGTTSSEFGAWLRGIIRNEIHSALRFYVRLRRESNVLVSLSELLEEDGNEPVAKVQPVDKVLLERERRAAIEQAIMTLPPDQGNLVTLVCLKGRSVRDAAKLCGVSAHAAYKKLSLALVRLRLYLRSNYTVRDFFDP